MLEEEVPSVSRINLGLYAKDLFFICSGIFCATIGLKGFLLPNGFLDGGVTGISLLVNKLTFISLPLLIFIINLPFIFIGARLVSKLFAIKTLLAIAALSIVLTFIDIPNITDDKVLIACFGGFFLGAGIGLNIRGGCVIDGTEVMAIFISRNSSMTVGDVIAAFNIIIFGVSAYLFDLETALYSMLTYLAASKTVDFLINGIEEYIGVTVISEKADEVEKAITVNLRRAVTIYKGEGGTGSHGTKNGDRKIIFSVVTRLEVQRLVIEIEKIDPDAFVVQHPIKDTKGGMIKKRPLH
ncbi:MAG: YitT family protein [Bacteroidia bacterium]|nr:YitT family protein [Bacteroidia bacterium]